MRILSAFMVLALAACGPSKSDQKGSRSTVEQPAAPPVGKVAYDHATRCHALSDTVLTFVKAGLIEDSSLIARAEAIDNEWNEIAAEAGTAKGLPVFQILNDFNIERMSMMVSVLSEPTKEGRNKQIEYIVQSAKDCKS